MTREGLSDRGSGSLVPGSTSLLTEHWPHPVVPAPPTQEPWAPRAARGGYGPGRVSQWKVTGSGRAPAWIKGKVPPLMEGVMPSPPLGSALCEAQTHAAIAIGHLARDRDSTWDRGWRRAPGAGLPVGGLHQRQPLKPTWAWGPGTGSLAGNRDRALVSGHPGAGRGPQEQVDFHQGSQGL